MEIRIGRGKAKRTLKQDELLQHVADADMRYREVKVTARARAKRMVEKEIAEYAEARALAVIQAYEGGVLKSHIAHEGLHTSGQNEVYAIISDWEQKQKDLSLPGLAKNPHAFEQVYYHDYGSSTKFAAILNRDEFIQPTWELVNGPEKITGEGVLFAWNSITKSWVWVNEIEGYKPFHQDFDAEAVKPYAEWVEEHGIEEI